MENKSELEVSFKRHMENWKKETCFYSSTRMIAENESYKAIIKMGISVVPLILNEMKKCPDHWFVALHELTGECPVPQSDRGNIVEMTNAWIKWGETKYGY